MEYTKTKKEIKDITVHGGGCIGCKRHKKDIMIAYSHNGSDDITDLFFTTEQAKELLKRLGERLQGLGLKTREWTKEKPKTPCLFVGKTSYNKRRSVLLTTEYCIYSLEYSEGYLAINDAESGEEWGDYEDFKCDEYFIIDEKF